ncbi:NF038120 family PEP-CTERM protein [Massilia sp. H-1]|nr:NF038120 family PEP-CTERM protein [Massilia sp. H-1]
MIGLMASLFAAPVLADTLTFDTLAPSVYESGTAVDESGYNMLFVEGPVAASMNLVSGIGAVLDSNDPFSCDVIGCPVGGNGNYLAILNDGGVQFTHPGQLNGFTISGLNFSFISPVPVGPGDYGQLVLSGTNWFGQSVSTTLAFPGQNNNGQFMFGAAALDAAFRGNVFTNLTISACIYDVNNACSNSVDSPAFNQAQFALDNVTLNAVPEPASFLLSGLGLAALGATRRRRATRSDLPLTARTAFMNLRPVSAAVALLLSTLAVSAHAQEARRSYIVQLADKPVATYTGGTLPPGGHQAGSLSTRLNVEATDVQNYIHYLETKQASVTATVPASQITHEYKVVFNGFAAMLTDDEVRSLKKNLKRGQYQRRLGHAARYQLHPDLPRSGRARRPVVAAGRPG